VERNSNSTGEGTSNLDAPVSTLDAAAAYVARGMAPIPVPHGQKTPCLKGWPDLRLAETELPAYFGDGPQNIGVLLGEPSGGVVDVDLDCPEALALATYFLPGTGCIYGRATKPASHWWYQANPIPSTAQFQDVDGTMLVELRSTGLQTLAPPSVHPSGELIRFEQNGALRHVEGDDLLTQVQKLATAVMFARHWPGHGSRNIAALALAGGLLRDGWDAEEAADFIERVATAAGDEEASARGHAVKQTVQRLDHGASITEWKHLAELVAQDVVKKGRGWLGGQTASASPTAAYRATPEGLRWRKPTNNGTADVLLTNFAAHIAADIAEDDGSSELRRLFEVEATLKGRTIQLSVPAEKFVSMNWPTEQLGAGAIIYPGFGTKDHARTAIQLLSGDIPERRVYVHTGWRQIEQEWCYLHAGGALGAQGALPYIEVRLPDLLARYALPLPADDDALRAAIRASLGLLAVAPESITSPLFASIWRAVLGGVDFSLHLAGPTGAGKSELAALVQQHWGAELDARHLPAAWSSTANALEGIAFHAKDALLVVDDFAPVGGQHDMQRMHKDADRLLRAQGNNAGRQRMRSDATLRPAKPPRGLFLSTGEDVPLGQSLRARLLVLELGPHDLDFTRLSECQADARAGQYAMALAGFIEWLAARYDDVHRTLKDEVSVLRDQATEEHQHRRTPEIVANLGVGLRYFLRYAEDVGALSTPDTNDLWDRAWKALGQAALAQGQHQEASEPTTRFLELLGTAITSGRAHLASKDGDRPERAEGCGWRLRPGYGSEAQGARVGWLDRDDVYLDAEAAFGAAQAVGQAVGDALSITVPTLTKRLKEHGRLASTESHGGKPRNTVRRTLEGRRRDVLHLHASSLHLIEVPQVSQVSPIHLELDGVSA
jgi:hypothetical protein